VNKKLLAIFVTVLMALAIAPMAAFAEDAGGTDNPPAATDTHTHSWSAWQTTKQATCTAAGTQQRTCKGCAQAQTRTVKATGHSWGKWKTTKAATALKAGKKTSTCSKCGAKKTKTIKKLKAYAKLSKKKLTLKAGKTAKLKVKYAKGDKVKSWKSSKKSVVAVSKSGKLKAKKAGKATITVKLKSGKKATCKVTVKAKKESSSSSKSNKSSKSSNSGYGTVYWTPNGTVYHTTPDCPSLARSHTIYSGSVSDSGKPRVCRNCG